METQEQERIGNNAKEINSLDFSKGEKTNERYALEGTPITVGWDIKNGWAWGIAEHRISEYHETEQECLEDIESSTNNWGVICRVMTVLMSKQRELTELETIIKNQND